MPELYSVERLTRDVARLGLSQGDTLMVHASLRAIGPTEGRVGGLIRALHDAVGPTGIRRYLKVMVSDHPEGRFAALGHAASALTNDPPWDNYFGPGSALERLVQRDGKVLRLGADTDTMTLLHHAEYLTDLPTRHMPQPRPRPMPGSGVASWPRTFGPSARCDSSSSLRQTRQFLPPLPFKPYNLPTRAQRAFLTF